MIYLLIATVAIALAILGGVSLALLNRLEALEAKVHTLEFPCE